MKYNIILTGANNSFTDALTHEFEQAEHTVSADYAALDLMIYCIDPRECSATDYDALLEAYDNTAIGLLREVSKYLPLLQLGSKKRLCFITKLQSSINQTFSPDHWERMITASCNMAIKTIFNRLNPLGYTFRLFAVEDYDHAEDVSYAMEYFLQDRSLEEESILHSDERRLVMRDKYEREYPW